MASPQLENGYTRIANELIEALMKTNLSAYQSRILWAIWRATYGFQRKEGWILNRQLVKMTGLKKPHVSRTISELIERNIVTKAGNKISFNKDYQAWRELPKRVTVTNSGNRITDWGYRSLPDGVMASPVEPIKTQANEHLKKEKKVYKEIYAQFFDQFWKSYPARNGKKLERNKTFEKYCALSETDLPPCNQAAANYANSENIRKGIGIKDPKRFLKDDYWREWIEPEQTHRDDGESYIERLKQREDFI